MEYKKSSELFFKHFVFLDIFYSRFFYEMTVNFNCGNNFLSFQSSLLKRSLHLMRRQNVDLKRGGGGGDSWKKGRGKKKHTTPLWDTVPRLLCFDKAKTTPREGTLDTTLNWSGSFQNKSNNYIVQCFVFKREYTVLEKVVEKEWKKDRKPLRCLS